MTNLLAIVAVCIATNVTTETDGKAGCPYGPGCLSTMCDHQPGRPATWKTVTTEVVETKTLRFTWDGRPYQEKAERVLSRQVRRFTRREIWDEQ